MSKSRRSNRSSSGTTFASLGPKKSTQARKQDKKIKAKAARKAAAAAAASEAAIVVPAFLTFPAARKDPISKSLPATHGVPYGYSLPLAPDILAFPAAPEDPISKSLPATHGVPYGYSLPLAPDILAFPAAPEDPISKSLPATHGVPYGYSLPLAPDILAFPAAPEESISESTSLSSETSTFSARDTPFEYSLTLAPEVLAFPAAREDPHSSLLPLVTAVSASFADTKVPFGYSLKLAPELLAFPAAPQPSLSSSLPLSTAVLTSSPETEGPVGYDLQLAPEVLAFPAAPEVTVSESVLSAPDISTATEVEIPTTIPACCLASASQATREFPVGYSLKIAPEVLAFPAAPQPSLSSSLPLSTAVPTSSPETEGPVDYSLRLASEVLAFPAARVPVSSSLPLTTAASISSTFREVPFGYSLDLAPEILAFPGAPEAVSESVSSALEASTSSTPIVTEVEVSPPVSACHVTSAFATAREFPFGYALKLAPEILAFPAAQEDVTSDSLSPTPKESASPATTEPISTAIAVVPVPEPADLPLPASAVPSPVPAFAEIDPLPATAVFSTLPGVLVAAPPVIVVSSPSASRMAAEMRGFGFARFLGLASAIVHSSIGEWARLAIMAGLIFGGCCSNVFALESIIKESADCGLLITFVQFVLVASVGLYDHFDIRNPPFFVRPNVVPMSRWLVYVVLFSSVNLLNNVAFGLEISVPMHIILRSGGSVTTMLVGRLWGKRYSPMQVASVVLLSVGIVVAALFDAQSKVRQQTLSFILFYYTAKANDQKADAETDSPGAGIGLAVLLVAQLLSAVMGIYIQRTYEVYGGAWREALFYSHLLSLPFFLPVLGRLRTQLWVLLDSPLVVFSTWVLPRVRVEMPVHLAMLGLNALTQYACIRGVNLLGAQASALTVTIVLNMRKLASLLISIWLFGNRLAPGVLAGAAVVFASGALYAWESQRVSAAGRRLAGGQHKKRD
ncbi:MAG: hypothetical protein M1825_002292 [Sarcosagium campestre]|nr:MAG: hypothetical protein M1825_002292 [Sarcosagium campestre]